MEAAIDAGFDNFLQFTNIGLFWLYMQNNVTLDGRFLDLETPFYLERPFIGKLTFVSPTDPSNSCLVSSASIGSACGDAFYSGLETNWSCTCNRVTSIIPQGRLFLKDLRWALRRRFHPSSFVFDDEAIRDRALAVFTPQFGAKRELQQIARLATDRYWKGSTATLPVWEPMSRQWAAPTPTPVKLQCPTFAAGPLGRDAQAFAAALERAGKAQDLKEVKEALGPLQRE